MFASSVDFESVWQNCLSALNNSLEDSQFNVWIKPLQIDIAPPTQQQPVCFTVLVASRFKLAPTKEMFHEKIKALLADICPVNFYLAWSVASSRQLSNSSEISHLVTETDLSRLRPNTSYLSTLKESEEIKTLSTSTTSASHNKKSSRLNSNLTFDNLIEGSANRMARAAALHVASTPGQTYNPLFIYGGVGLGKTHLMHSIGNAVLQHTPDAQVLYVHAEKFVSDVVKAYQHKNFDGFKESYHRLDLLLIDDIQFFANKDRSQEEFFNAFESLLAKKSHIVMTSDTYPKNLSAIHERLISRFDSGLTTGIEPPELEMRVAILIQKAREEGTPLSDDIAFFVAKNIRSNVRELEGAFRKILAFSKFNQKPVNIDTAKEALKDLLSIQNRLVSIENIQKTVADYYKIKVADMYSNKRPANIAKPRQIAMYLSKELTQKSLPEIGELFGGRDHTTVLYAVRKVTQDRQKHPDFNQVIHLLEQTLKGSG